MNLSEEYIKGAAAVVARARGHADLTAFINDTNWADSSSLWSNPEFSKLMERLKFPGCLGMELSKLMPIVKAVLLRLEQPIPTLHSSKPH
jgi:hypothetical protein